MNKDFDPFTDLPPEDAKEFFIELVQEVVECEAPYEWKKKQIREGAGDMGVTLSEKEIEDLLADNEKNRKEKWEATLKRFGKK